MKQDETCKNCGHEKEEHHSYCSIKNCKAVGCL